MRLGGRLGGGGGNFNESCRRRMPSYRRLVPSSSSSSSSSRPSATSAYNNNNHNRRSSYSSNNAQPRTDHKRHTPTGGGGRGGGDYSSSSSNYNHNNNSNNKRISVRSVDSLLLLTNPPATADEERRLKRELQGAARWCARRGDAERALGIARTWQRMNLPAKDSPWASAVAAAARAGGGAAARDMLDVALFEAAKSATRPSKIRFGGDHRGDGAGPSQSPPVGVFNAAIAAFAREGDTDTAALLFQAMTDRGVHVTEATYHSLMIAAANATTQIGDARRVRTESASDAARRMYREMGAARLRRTARTVACVGRCVKADGTIEDLVWYVREVYNPWRYRHAAATDGPLASAGGDVFATSALVSAAGAVADRTGLPVGTMRTAADNDAWLRRKQKLPRPQTLRGLSAASAAAASDIDVAKLKAEEDEALQELPPAPMFDSPEGTAKLSSEYDLSFWRKSLSRSKRCDPYFKDVAAEVLTQWTEYEDRYCSRRLGMDGRFDHTLDGLEGARGGAPTAAALRLCRSLGISTAAVAVVHAAYSPSGLDTTDPGTDAAKEAREFAATAVRVGSSVLASSLLASYAETGDATRARLVYDFWLRQRLGDKAGVALSTLPSTAQGPKGAQLLAAHYSVPPPAKDGRPPPPAPRRRDRYGDSRSVHHAFSTACAEFASIAAAARRPAPPDADATEIRAAATAAQLEDPSQYVRWAFHALLVDLPKTFATPIAAEGAPKPSEEEMRKAQSRHMTEEGTWRALLHVCAASRCQGPLALAALRLMLAQGHRPTSAVVTRIVSACGRDRNTGPAVAVANSRLAVRLCANAELKARNGVELPRCLDGAAWTALLDAYVKAGRPDAALAIGQKLLAEGAVAAAAEEQIHAAVVIGEAANVKSVKTAELPPSILPPDAMRAAAFEENPSQELMRLKSSFGAQGYGVLLRCCLQLSEVPAALSLYMDMDRNVPRSGSFSASGTTNALSSVVGGSAALESVDMHHDDLLVRICSGSLGALDGALLIAKASIRDKSRPPLRSSTLFALVRALCRGAQPKRAFRLLSLCSSLGYGWGDRETVMSVIESLSSAGEMTTAWGLYQRARGMAKTSEVGWMPSASCASSLIILLCQAGRADRALGVYVDLVTSRDDAPDRLTTVSDSNLVRKSTMLARQGRLPYAKAMARLVVACCENGDPISASRRGAQASTRVGSRTQDVSRDGGELLSRARALYSQLLAMPGGDTEAANEGVWRALIPALLACGDVLGAATVFGDADAAGEIVSVGRGALAYLHAQILHEQTSLEKDGGDADDVAKLSEAASKIVEHMRVSVKASVAKASALPKRRRKDDDDM
ncbi:hypothetical protein NFJ02_08g136920 [Pycnococcus provasolii]